MTNASKGTPRVRRAHLLSTGHAAEALNEAEWVIDVLREALRAARLTLTSGGIAMDTVRQIDRALAAAEGKGETNG